MVSILHTPLYLDMDMVTNKWIEQAFIWSLWDQTIDKRAGQYLNNII